MLNFEATHLAKNSCGLLQMTRLQNCASSEPIQCCLVKRRSVCLRMRPLTFKASQSVTRLACCDKIFEKFDSFEEIVDINGKTFAKHCLQRQNRLLLKSCKSLSILRLLTADFFGKFAQNLSASAQACNIWSRLDPKP